MTTAGMNNGTLAGGCEFVSNYLPDLCFTCTTAFSACRLTSMIQLFSFQVFPTCSSNTGKKRDVHVCYNLYLVQLPDNSHRRTFIEKKPVDELTLYFYAYTGALYYHRAEN